MCFDAFKKISFLQKSISCHSCPSSNPPLITHTHIYIYIMQIASISSWIVFFLIICPSALALGEAAVDQIETTLTPNSQSSIDEHPTLERPLSPVLPSVYATYLSDDLKTKRLENLSAIRVLQRTIYQKKSILGDSKQFLMRVRPGLSRPSLSTQQHNDDAKQYRHLQSIRHFQEVKASILEEKERYIESIINELNALEAEIVSMKIENDAIENELKNRGMDTSLLSAM